MFIGCNEHDYITIASPNKSKCLTVEQVTSIRPGFKPYLKLYFGVTSLNKNEAMYSSLAERVFENKSIICYNALSRVD